MFIFTLKGQNIKLFFSFLLSAAIIISVVILAPVGGVIQDAEASAVLDAAPAETGDFKNVSTNEDRVKFLNKFGWVVEEQASQVTNVLIPTEFDTIYEKYNQMQLAEGLDLEKYKGKSVKKYTYLVLNYDFDGSVFANLLIYGDRVIGGDISSARTDGFVHGFTKTNDFQT